jgi:small-conductance mechanosensitive channel/CRP-like cAMP-binding protein
VSVTVQLTLVALGALALFGMASALTAPMRRRSRQDEGATGVPHAFRRLLAMVSRPVLVLAATEVLLQALRVWAPELDWLKDRPAHLRAWRVFWSLAVLVSLLEGLAEEFYCFRRRTFPVPDLMRNIIRALLLAGAGLFVLRAELGVDIAPLLGASALVTAVIGFALQGVLGNLLAGISLHITRSVVPSDWIAVGKLEGEVLQTNWRETRIRTVAGHVIVIPNSTVAVENIHNMSRPTPLRRHQVEVGASYADAPGDVLEALLQSARSVPEVLAEPEPSASIVAYLDFGIQYRLHFWTHRYYDRVPLEGNVMRMIWYQFKRRGIEIPFPMSDKLLNDFMEVVYNQRRLPPEKEDVGRTIGDLMRSDLAAQLLTDEQGAPLLNEEQWAAFAARTRRTKYTRGETLFRQGDTGEWCCVVARGTLRGRVEQQGAAGAAAFEIGPGALVGEMSLLTGLPRAATVSCEEECELIEIGREAFTQLLAVREDIPARLAKIVADRAARNAAAFERLKASQPGAEAHLRKEGILGRFLRLLGR